MEMLEITIYKYKIYMEFPIKKKPSHGKSGEDDMRCHVFPTDGPVHHDPKHSI